MKSQILLVLAVLFLNQQNAILQPVEKIREENRNETGRSFLSTPELFGIKSTESSHIDWANLQWPPTANIAVGGSVTVYVRCYEEGCYNKCRGRRTDLGMDRVQFIQYQSEYLDKLDQSNIQRAI